MRAFYTVESRNNMTRRGQVTVSRTFHYLHNARRHARALVRKGRAKYATVIAYRSGTDVQALEAFTLSRPAFIGERAKIIVAKRGA